MTTSERAAFQQETPSSRRGFGTRARFHDAHRNSRRVRLFRRATPVFVLLALGAVAIYAWLDPFRVVVDLPVELGRASLSGSRIKMEFPKLSGFTADNRGYKLTAEAASQDLGTPNRIDLEQIKARIELEDQGWATLTAVIGSYDTKSQQIQLGDGVVVETNSGYGGQLQDAQIDMQAGRLVTEHPVRLTHEDNWLTADSMEVTQKDSRALFTGNVTVFFRLPPEGEAAGAASSAGAKSSTAATPHAGTAPSAGGTSALGIRPTLDASPSATRPAGAPKP